MQTNVVEPKCETKNADENQLLFQLRGISVQERQLLLTT